MGRRPVGALQMAMMMLSAFAGIAGAATRVDPHAPAPIKLLGAAPPVPMATTQAVPELAAQGASERAIHKLYKSEYDSTAPADRQMLARKLLLEGLETRDDWTARYVLLRNARDIATHCGDLPTALKAVDDLARVYGLDAGDMTLSMLNAAGRMADTVETLEPVVRTAISCMDAAGGRDNYVLGLKLGDLAEAQAIRARKPTLTALVQERVKELREQQKEWELAKAARATLKVSPADAEAKRIAGKFACFVHGDWDMALPLLLGCADVPLRTLAEHELAKPVDAGEQVQLANDWWDLAERQGHVAKLHLQMRAAEWYRRALPQLAGIKKDTVEKRLEEVESANMSQLMLEPGLATELFAAENFTKRFMTRVDAQINFDWGLGAAAEGMPKDNFSLRWTGVINVRTGGRYTIWVTANDGARVVIDEKVLLDEPSMSHKRAGMKVPVEFSAGVHSLRVEFWDGGGEANIKLMWIPPGSTKEEIIPAWAFYHEAGVVR